MDWWDTRAAHLQAMGRSSEGQKDELYSQDDANRAAVYTREDLILVVSHLSSLNRQIATIRNILIALTVIVGYLAIRAGL